MMDSTVIAAIISAVGGIIVTLLSVPFGRNLRSKSFRSHNRTPNILGTWQNDWFINDKLYVKDIMIIEKWVKNNQFQGKGHEPKGTYIVSGEINERILVATYKNKLFPTKGYTGTFVLKLSVDGKSMKGYWHGRTLGGRLKGGKVVCKKSG